MGRGPKANYGRYTHFKSAGARRFGSGHKAFSLYYTQRWAFFPPSVSQHVHNTHIAWKKKRRTRGDASSVWRKPDFGGGVPII